MELYNNEIIVDHIKKVCNIFTTDKEFAPQIQRIECEINPTQYENVGINIVDKALSEIITKSSNLYTTSVIVDGAKDMSSIFRINDISDVFSLADGLGMYNVIVNGEQEIMLSEFLHKSNAFDVIVNKSNILDNINIIGQMFSVIEKSTNIKINVYCNRSSKWDSKDIVFTDNIYIDVDALDTEVTNIKSDDGSNKLSTMIHLPTNTKSYKVTNTEFNI